MNFKNKIILVTSLFVFAAAISAVFLIKNNRSDASFSKNEASAEESFNINTNENLGSFYLTIDKIKIRAPIIRGVDPTDEEKYNLALKDGVAHMIGSALPGQGNGNVFIYGHSSADEAGKYSQIFAKMDELSFGDKIKVSFDGQDHEYWVAEKKFIEKDDFSVLDQSGEERLTLMACWPIGTDDRRIIVVAKRK